MSNTQNPLVALKLTGIKAQFIVDLIADETEAKEAEDKGSALEAHCKANGLKNGETVLESIKADQKAFADGAKLNSGEVITLRKMLEKVARPVEETKQAASSAVQQAAVQIQMPTRLPMPQLGKPLLSNLSKETLSEVLPADLVAGFQVMLAYQHNLFDTAERVRAAILARATATHKQVHPFFHKINKLLNRRAAADALNAMGVSGENVNEQVRREFLAKFIGSVVPAVQTFHSKMVKAFDAHQAIANNPAAMQQAMMGMMHMMAGGQPAMVAPTAKFDSKTIRMALASLIETINIAYSPLGVPAERALLAEASEINEFLGNEELRTAIGVTTREEVLIELKVGLTEEQLSEESGLAQYILGVMELPKQQAGSNQELLMVMELIQLGNSLTTLVGPAPQPPRTNGRRSDRDSDTQNDGYARSSNNGYGPHKG